MKNLGIDSVKSKSDNSRHVNRRATHATFTGNKHDFNTENSNQLTASNLNLQKSQAIKMHSLDQIQKSNNDCTPNNFNEHNGKLY